MHLMYLSANFMKATKISKIHSEILKNVLYCLYKRIWKG